MIIYRPHRGGLAESMTEAKEFTDRDAMFRHIVEQHTDLERGPAFSVDDLLILERAVDDLRTGWHDTRYVCTRRYFWETYDYPACIGMCAEDYDK